MKKNKSDMSMSFRLAVIIGCLFILIQKESYSQYEFKNEKRIACTDVKSQDITGTCWSFSTTSFLESELIRKGKGEYDLSEMYTVRSIYSDKARNYMLRQGKAGFSQGALAHDLLRAFEQDGAVPEEVYSGLLDIDSTHNHSEMEAGLKGYLDGVRAGKKISSRWPIAFESILDAYLGEAPSDFTYKGKKFTPKSFAESLEIKVDDYVSITSFTHHPYYESFILEIPDNYSNGSYFNVSLAEMVSIVDYAIANGYSIAWDGDVSEKTFQMRKGLAILPSDINRDSLLSIPGEEIEVNSENRQRNFESLQTTDDHLMHLIGTAVDERGTKYYIIKNSWGDKSHFEGYLYMSEAYLKMKTVSIMLHKDGLSKEIYKKLVSE